MIDIIGTIIALAVTYGLCVRFAIEIANSYVRKLHDDSAQCLDDPCYNKLWVRILYILGPITIICAIMAVSPKVLKYAAIYFGILMRNIYNWIIHGKFGSRKEKNEPMNSSSLTIASAVATTSTPTQKGRVGQWHISSYVQRKRNGEQNMSIDYATRTYRLTEGLACGDSIGVTTEFCSGPGRVIATYDKFHRLGWPFVSVGKKKWGLKPGDHTDDTDMACCILKSVYDEFGNEMDVSGHRVDPVSISEYFVRWLNTNPKDIGKTTHSVLCKLRDGVAWNDAGYEVWQTNKNGAANGSLMRNGVMGGFTNSLSEALDNTFLHGIITHYGALPVLTCAIQTWLMHKLFNDDRNPLNDMSWLDNFLADWEAWIVETEIQEVDEWIQRVGETHINEGIDTLKETEWSHYDFNPFTHNIGSSAGYCVLTLQIAIWALKWSLDTDNVFEHPDNLPNKVFEKIGKYRLGWIPLIAYDSDTYGATAGPLFVAAHGTMPREMTKNLEIHDWFKNECNLVMS